MAGEWIKVEKSTARKPEVLAIAEALEIHPDHAFGLCVRFWCWCDDHLSNCNAHSVTKKSLDAGLSVSGFADALIKVGWLEVRSGSLSIPHFDRHLSQSSKTRGLTQKRVSKLRGENCNAHSVTKSLPEEEEDNINANINKKRPKSLDEVIATGHRSGVLKEDCEAFWHHFEASGWKDKNGHEIQSWSSKLMSWKNFALNQKGQEKWKGGSSANNGGNQRTERIEEGIVGKRVTFE